MPRGASNHSKEKLSEWGKLGGQASHSKGSARRWTPEQAKEMGRLGGLKKQANWREKQNANSSGSNGGGGSNQGDPPKEE